MSVWQLVTDLVGQHLIPTLLASAAIYLALRLLFAVGRLRRPRDQVVFLQGLHAEGAAGSLGRSQRLLFG